MKKLIVAVLLMSIFLIGCRVEKPKEVKLQAPQSQTQTDIFIEITAEKGDSYTTLARKAIATYLTKNSKTLSKDKEVFAEDSLIKKYKSKIPLNPKDKMSFPVQDLVKAIDNSIAPGHLKKYTRKVNWSHYSVFTDTDIIPIPKPEKTKTKEPSSPFYR
jgi:hypothetical protein